MLTQQERSDVWYWEPSQLHRAGEIMDLERKTTMVILLNQSNLPLHSKYLPSYPQVNAVPIPRQGNFSLQQIRDHYGKPQWVKMQLQSIVVTDTSTNPAP